MSASATFERISVCAWNNRIDLDDETMFPLVA
jgi:hypothetical protein